MWMKLDKAYLGQNENLIIGSIYIPPENSDYSTCEAFTEIENDLLELFPT